MENFDVTTIAERPDLADECTRLHTGVFPKYMRYQPLSVRPIIKYFNYMVIFLQDEKVIAVGGLMPMQWNGNKDELPTYPNLVKDGINIQDEQKQFNCLGALFAAISSNHQGKGLSYQLILEMKKMAKMAGCEHLMLPIRPTLKCQYPYSTLSEYLKLRRDDGSYYDPWVRVHHKLGGEIVNLMEECDIFSGPINEWEKVTDQKFRQSGSYIVPRALSPLEIDVAKNVGTISEGNIWIKHSLF